MAIPPTRQGMDRMDAIRGREDDTGLLPGDPCTLSRVGRQDRQTTVVVPRVPPRQGLAVPAATNDGHSLP